MKNRLYLVLLAIVLLAVLIGGCGSNSSAPSDQTQINAVLDNFSTAVMTKNLNLCLSCFADPFDAHGTTTSHADLTTLFSTIPKFDYYQFNSRVIAITGSTATVTCVMHVNLTGDTPPDPDVNSTFTLVKTNGTWLITKWE